LEVEVESIPPKIRTGEPIHFKKDIRYVGNHFVIREYKGKYLLYEGEFAAPDVEIKTNANGEPIKLIRNVRDEKENHKFHYVKQEIILDQEEPRRPLSEPVDLKLPEKWSCPKCGATNILERDFCHLCNSKKSER
jgi:hypothetical protein